MHNNIGQRFTQYANRRPKQCSIERDRVIWLEKKTQSLVTAERLRKIGKTNRYYRMHDCANTIISDICSNCETRYVVQVDFCRDRLCPICTWRRSRKLTQRLGCIIAACEREYHSRYIFLTLTVRNVPWSELAEQIKIIMSSWDRFGKRLRRAAAVTGWVKTIEVTRSKERGDAHPHLHILMQVPPEYFDETSPLYMRHRKDDLIDQWQQCLRETYSPSISIKAVRDSNYAIGRAVAETTKYIAKGSDINGLSDAEFADYVAAIHGVRSWSTGGRMRVSDEDIEEYLHDGEMSHAEGICGNCGGKLIEMREVWSNIAKAYTIKVDIDYNDLGQTKSEFAAASPVTGGRVINLNINTGGGDVHVGRDICGDGARNSKTGD